MARSTRRRENAQAVGHSVSSAFFRKPVGGGGLEEFGDGDTLAADEELGGGMVGFVEGGDAGQGFLATSAFDLDGDKGVAALEHEVHLQIPLAPVGDLDAGAHGGIDKWGQSSRIHIFRIFTVDQQVFWWLYPEHEVVLIFFYRTVQPKSSGSPIRDGP